MTALADSLSLAEADAALRVVAELRMRMANLELGDDCLNEADAMVMELEQRRSEITARAVADLAARRQEATLTLDTECYCDEEPWSAGTCPVHAQPR